MTHSKLPPVHIILLNYNGWRDTIACLDSVLQLEYPDFSVVVCDNASTDDSVEQLERWDEGRRAGPHGERSVQLMPLGSNTGFGGGNNAAMRDLLANGATGFIWLLNNDTIVARDSLRLMVEAALANGSTGAVGATMLEFRMPDVVQAAAGGTISTFTGMARNACAGAARANRSALEPRFNYICGACLLVPIPVLREVGLFDERFFMYVEDADLCRRIAARGYELLYAPEAEIWHKGAASSVQASPFHDFHNVRSSLIFVRKHRPWLFPLSLTYITGRTLLPKLVRRQWHRLPALFKAYRDVLFTNT